MHVLFHGASEIGRGFWVGTPGAVKLTGFTTYDCIDIMLWGLSSGLC